MRREIFGYEDVNEGEYRVAAALEVDWSKGKSWSQHQREKSKVPEGPSKAVIRSSENNNL